ncbi:MAG: aminoacyl-tRNA hydrolase [Parcubacteria group bacterium]|nr:aminoacyl-tRNA hydrolase [Parcubacteria group bacterium]
MIAESNKAIKQRNNETTKQRNNKVVERFVFCLGTSAACLVVSLLLCFNILMKHLIVGLGNPGNEYEKTRHNAGRMVLEHFRKEHGLPEWERDAKRDALVSKGEVGGVAVELLLPETFMNNSGLSLKSSTYNLKPSFLIVVHDDLDLPLGSLKIAYNRGSAGHRGVDSIIQVLGTKKFTRIRIGVAPQDASGKIKKTEGEDAASKFVLKKFSPAEWEKMEEAIDAANDALFTILKEGREKAMNAFNKKENRI